MPELVKNLSLIKTYGVILSQHVVSIPGVFIGSWLVDTRFGRRYTILLSFVLAGLCCFFFYIESNIISVLSI